MPLISGVLNKLRKLDAYMPVELVIRAVFSLLLSRARIFSDFAPFGIGFVAAAPAGWAGAVTLAAAVIGCFSFGDIFWSIKYIAIFLVIRVSLRIFKGTPMGRMELFPPALTFFVSLCIGSVYAFGTGWSLVPTVLFVVESFLSGGCAFFYDVALSPWSDSASGKSGRVCHNVSTLILFGTLLMSLSSWMLFSVISIGRLIAVIGMMCAVYRGGICIGCAISTGIGAAMDLACGSVPFFTMSYSFTAMVSGIFSRGGRLIFLLTYIASNAITVVWNWDTFSMLPALYEVFAASVVFMLIPDSAFAKMSALFPANMSGYGFLKAREYTRDRVELASSAFKQLYDVVRDKCGEETCDNVAAVFDRASDLVCRSCPRSAKCWQQDYSDTVDIMNNITPVLMKNGSVSTGDFPSRFTESCQRLTQLTAAINAETRTFLCRRQYRTRLSESRSAAYSQYNDISAVLHSLSQELGSEVTVEPGLEKKLQKYLRGLDLDASTAVFRVKGGRLRAELRGSGVRALRRDKDCLDKLSALLGTRLCTPEDRSDPDLMVLLEAEPLRVAIGTASAKKDGESVSGDDLAYFRTDEGNMFVLLSDGMGSGEEASKLSRGTNTVMERFLKAGIPPELTIKILSDLMILKSDDDIASATVDLMCLDMFSGDTRIFKCGAAPSYIKKGNTVRRLSQPMPRPFHPPYQNSVPKSRMSPGSFAVMVSDGVVAGGDDWLRDLISGYEGQNPRELAMSVLNRAKEASGCCDDMTVMALKIDIRP